MKKSLKLLAAMYGLSSVSIGLAYTYNVTLQNITPNNKPWSFDVAYFYESTTPGEHACDLANLIRRETISGGIKYPGSHDYYEESQAWIPKLTCIRQVVVKDGKTYIAGPFALTYSQEKQAYINPPYTQIMDYTK